MTKKYWSFADAPPLADVSSHQNKLPNIDSLVDNIANNATGKNPYNDREWYRRR